MCAGAHLVAGRARRSAHRRLGGAGGHHAEDGRLRFPAIQPAHHARMPSREFDWLLIALSLIAVVYIGFVALVQTGHEEAHRLFVHRAHGLRDAGLLSWCTTSSPPPDRVQGAGMGIDGAMVQMISHGLISGALFLCVGVMYDRVHSARDQRLRRRDQHHAEVRARSWCCSRWRIPAAGHVGIRRRVPRDPRRLQGQLLVRVPRRPHADPRRGLHAVAGQARDLRRSGQSSRRGAAGSQLSASSSCSGMLAVAVLLVGLWPAPLLDVMQATVQHLSQQIPRSKLPHDMNAIHLVEPAARAAGDLPHGGDLRAADGRRVLRRDSAAGSRPRSRCCPAGRRCGRHRVLSRTSDDARAAVRRQLRGRSAGGVAEDLRLRRPSRWRCCIRASTSSGAA